MSLDNRRALPKGYELTIAEEGSENQYSVVITDEIGRGGSCIVYKGERPESIGGDIKDRSVVVKEFYPVGLDIKRKRNRKLDISELSAQEIDNYRKLQEHFAEGQSRSAEFYDYYMDQALPRLFIYGEANNTVYAVSDPGKGRTLSEINFDDPKLDLNRIASIMESICDAISKIHTKRKLYLDCKPDNFFYYYNNRDLQSKVYLFDFDTIVDIDDIQKGNYKFCSASKGWIPPEQHLVRNTKTNETSYHDPQLIGYHTDIFSVGAIFFWLLTQRNPTEREIQEGTFDIVSNCRFCSGADIEVIKVVQDLLQSLLRKDATARQEMFRHYLSIRIIRKQFETLYGLTAGDNVHFEPLHTKMKHIESILLDNSEQIGDANAKLDDILDSIEKQTNVKLDAVLDAIDLGAAGADAKLDDILKAIERGNKTSLKEVLFGTKKKVAITIATFAVIAIAFGAISALGERAVDKVSPNSFLEIEQQMDEHIILKLANANHQYEVGLENWRRLDYIRAERDISEAMNNITDEKSQAEIEVAKINNSLGCLYLDMGRYEDSYDYLNNAYITFKDEYGEQAPETLATLFSIAQYDFFVGDYEAALKMSQQILDIMGPSEEKTIVTLIKHFQASLYAGRGEYEKALSAYQEALVLFNDYLEDDILINELDSYTKDSSLKETEKEKYTNMVRWIAKTYGNIGEVYYYLGEYELAKKNIETGLNMCLNNPYIGKKDIETANLYLKKARTENQTGDRAEALDDVDLAVRIERNIFNFEEIYPGLVEAYDLYGVILEGDGQKPEAESYYEKALVLSEDSFGINHPKTAEACYFYGLYDYNCGKYEDAEEYIQKAIEIRKNILGEKHPDTIKYYNLLADIYLKLGIEDSYKKNKANAERIKTDLGI